MTVLESLNHSFTSSVRMINMPAASFIAKVEREVHTISAAAYQKLNDLFNQGSEKGGDDLFKKVVVDEFLFR